MSPRDVAEDGVFFAIGAWLRAHDLDAECFERGLVVREAMGEYGVTIWDEEGPPTLECEDLAPLVARRLGRDYPDAPAHAVLALVQAVHKFGPMPSDPDRVPAYLDGIVRWATRRTRQLIVLYHAPPQAYIKMGLGKRALPTVCSWSRSRGARATRSRRHVVRRRARSPARPSGDPPRHDVVRPARLGGLSASPGDRR